jgi:aminoglycoside phosphotransferase family enzyme/predicted kinase
VSATGPSVRAALADPTFYPHRPAPVEVVETHGSWVFLAGPLAYKVRKPVRLPFLDYSTLERREDCARREIRLNRRLAPDLYLGLRPIVSGPDGTLVLGPSDAEDAVEWAVEMRRFDERRTMASRLERGTLSAHDDERVGRRLADFHGGARHVAGTLSANLERERRAAEQSLDELVALLPAGDPRPAAGRRFLHWGLHARRAQLEARAAHGLVRDGHGDLRAAHVLLEERVAIFDCIEFDDDLRALDVGADLAFLLSDLEARGGRDHARAVVRAYRAAGGDPGDDALLALFGVTRAWVRAKIALLRGNAPEADRLLATADHLRWRARGPLVLCVAGVAASGKSTLAGALAELAGVPVLSSDVLRKRAAGLDPSARAPVSLYDRSTSLDTYRELGRAARRQAREHGVAVVDATFRRAADRRAFETGYDGPAHALRFAVCTAPEDVLDARARAREADPLRVSDAGADVARAQRREWEPMSELPAQWRSEIRTDRPAADQLEAVETFLDRL